MLKLSELWTGVGFRGSMPKEEPKVEADIVDIGLQKLSKDVDALPPFCSSVEQRDAVFLVFDAVSDYLNLPERLGQRETGYVPRNTDPVRLEEHQREALQDMFEGFFNPERWNSADDMRRAWKEIPNTVKRVDLGVVNAASIYRNALALKQINEPIMPRERRVANGGAEIVVLHQSAETLESHL